MRYGLAAAAVVLAGIALVLLAPALRTPPHIPPLTITNDQEYLVVVKVSDGASASIAVGTVRRESTAAFEGLLDLGDVWVFSFSYAGVEAGTLRSSRAELVASGWRVVVPESVGRQLRAAGLEPSAR